MVLNLNSHQELYKSRSPPPHNLRYMDPGNWATDLEGGSKFEYTLLSMVVRGAPTGLTVYSVGLGTLLVGGGANFPTLAGDEDGFGPAHSQEPVEPGVTNSKKWLCKHSTRVYKFMFYVAKMENNLKQHLVKRRPCLSTIHPILSHLVYSFFPGTTIFYVLRETCQFWCSENFWSQCLQFE